MRTIFLALLFILMARTSQAASVTGNLPFSVLPAGCNSPQATVDNLAPRAGDAIHVALTCANTVVSIGLFHQTGATAASVPTGGANGNFTLLIPLVHSDVPLSWAISLNLTTGGNVWGPTINVMPTFSQVFGNALPASAGGDPFVPQHTITVCASGCQFRHPKDAIDSATNQNWDFVLITIEPGDYKHDVSNQNGGFSANLITLDYGVPPQHLWVKGIIGNSGTDGTKFPHFYGTSTYGEALLGAGQQALFVVDNIEFGPYNYGCCSGTALKSIYRNIYVHDVGGLGGMLTVDDWPADLSIYNSHFARNGSGCCPGHDLYIGNGNKVSTFILQNSVAEQPFIGHSVKTRAMSSTLTCDKILINQDPYFLGSEQLDCSEGRECHVKNTMFISGGITNDQTDDTIRYGADREFATLANNIMDLQGSTLIFDKPGETRFVQLFQRLSPSPPYPMSNNKFVFHDAGSMMYRNNPFTPARDNGFNEGGSAVVYGVTTRGATSADITIDNTNKWYSDRALAGLPPVPTYPVPYTHSSYNGVMPAACTDPIGLVKLPAK